MSAPWALLVPGRGREQAHEPALRAVGTPGARARSPRALPPSPLRCGRARAAARAPFVTTLRTRASAPRRHPGSWPDVMVFRAGAWTAHAKPVHLVPPPSISSLSPPSRPSTFHLVPRLSFSSLYLPSRSFTQRDQRVRNEIDVREARSRPGQRDRRARNEPQPSISSLYLPSRSFTQRDQRVRSEVDVRGTRARPGQRDRRRSSSSPPGAATRRAHPGACSWPLGGRTPRCHPPAARSALESTVNRRCCVSGRR